MSWRSTSVPMFRTHVFRTRREPRGRAEIRSCRLHRPLPQAGRRPERIWPKRRCPRLCAENGSGGCAGAGAWAGERGRPRPRGSRSARSMSAQLAGRVEPCAGSWSSAARCRCECRAVRVALSPACLNALAVERDHRFSHRVFGEWEYAFWCPAAADGDHSPARGHTAASRRERPRPRPRRHRPRRPMHGGRCADRRHAGSPPRSRPGGQVVRCASGHPGAAVVRADAGRPGGGDPS